MSNRFSHIDDKFRDAFQQWEAPHTPEEMMGDWQSLSKQLPQAPAHPSAPSSPGAGSGSGIWGMGKLAAISGAAAVVGATTAIIVYNIYKDDSQPVAETIPANEPAVVIADEQLSNESAVQDEKAVVVTPEMMQEASQADQKIKDSRNKISANTELKSQKTNSASGEPMKPEAVGASSGGDTPTPGSESQTTSVADNEKIRKEQLSAFRNAISEVPAQLCVGESLKLNTKEWPSTTTINWGDGAQGYANASSVHTYNAPGTYKLTVQSGGQPVSKIINVYRQPDAHFSLHQSIDLMCKFKNASLHAVKYVWDFGDSSASVTTYNGAEHKYRIAGDRIVTMIAYNDAGCADTTKQKITVSAYGKPEIKTAITPNGDGFNDEMSVVIENETYYQMTILDLSGRKVFESDDKKIQWNGRYMNTGEMLPAGQYIYSFTYRFEGEGKTRQESGFVIKDPDLLRR